MYIMSNVSQVWLMVFFTIAEPVGAIGIDPAHLLQLQVKQINQVSCSGSSGMRELSWDIFSKVWEWLD
jgi:hypothetical protein